MSFTSMVNAVSIPVGQAGSMFKNPASEGLSALGDTTAGLTALGTIVPGFDVASITTPMTGLMSDVSTHVTAKVMNLPKEMGIAKAAGAAKAECSRIDALAAGLPEGSADAIAKAYPPKAKPCKGSIIEDAFATLSGSSTLLKELGQSVTEIFDGMKTALTPIFGAIKTLTGAVIESAKDMFAALKNMGSSVLAALKSAVAPFASAFNAIKGAVGDIVGKISSAVSGFASMVAAEASALTQAASQAINTAFVNLFGSNDPCVKAIMSNVVNPEAVDHKVLAVMDGPKPKTAADKAVSIVKADAPLTPSSVVAATKSKVLPQDIPIANPYNSVELRDLTKKVDDLEDEMKEKKAANAKWAKTNLVDWQESIGYYDMWDVVGASSGSPMGTKGSPEDLAKWKDIQDQLNEKTEYYNKNFWKPYLDASRKYQDAKEELTCRRLFGKTPYTHLKEHYGGLKGNTPSTILDSGV